MRRAMLNFVTGCLFVGGTYLLVALRISVPPVSLANLLDPLVYPVPPFLPVVAVVLLHAGLMRIGRPSGASPRGRSILIGALVLETPFILYGNFWIAAVAAIGGAGYGALSVLSSKEEDTGESQV